MSMLMEIQLFLGVDFSVPISSDSIYFIVGPVISRPGVSWDTTGVH